MSADLMGTVKLLHRVFAFLADRSAAELADVVSGRAVLTAVAAPQEGTAVPGRGPAPGGESTRPVPEPQPAAEPFDYTAIVAKLRDQSSTTEGASYLNALTIRGKKATKTDLIAVGAAMGLTLASGTLKADAVRKLVEHAIGTHRKFAGLNSW